MIKKYLILALFLFINNATASNLLEQRWQFEEAKKALDGGNVVAFNALSAQLKDYSLADYLRYFYLKSYVDQQYPQTIKLFLNNNQNAPFARSLRVIWLKSLAKQADWDSFLNVYTPQKNTILKCHFLTAYIKKYFRLNQELLNSAKDLWLVGKSQPNACDQVFNYLYTNNIISPDLRLQRSILAIKNGNSGLAGYLAKDLPIQERRWIWRWKVVYQNPAKVLRNFRYKNTKYARELLVYGLRRLAAKDAELAYEYWKSYQNYLTLKEKDELLSYIALKAASQKHFKAELLLEQVDNELMTEKVILARLQIYLLKKNWQAIVKLIESLPVAKHEYWYARALEKVGNHQKAKRIYKKLAKNRDYYGFLAADRLGQAYQFNSQPLNISKKVQTELLNKYRGLQRARELYFLKFNYFARLEWNKVLAKLTTEEIKTAATLANSWGWHNRAIVTLAKVQYWDDLEIRFPLAFYDDVIGNAEIQNLDYSYVYGVIRQESIFQIDARSRSGANGLMQVMPATAKYIIRRQKFNDIDDVLLPANNIKLGSAYLRMMLNMFNNNHILATAAYNGGPTNAKRWAKAHPCVAPDIWVELIPFSQTRKYVKRVLSYAAMFESRMVDKVKPMKMDPICHY
ncbi:transglycosylase SLT domain-containing protein [Candidatus Marithrix sp. Canyon 246]|uniref:transglycosylase SLT domain-containing protein n=1 Tax=Candidatus Marithrix sp. Canyon 246 TaxID=1827136 RepID=UPI000849FA5A|nr:transglycosylase SLT domain-containing protein [Candidatus Marithrix sp. Canyon 246]